jgi:hypothetical protein
LAGGALILGGDQKVHEKYTLNNFLSAHDQIIIQQPGKDWRESFFNQQNTGEKLRNKISICGCL